MALDEKQPGSQRGARRARHAKAKSTPRRELAMRVRFLIVCEGEKTEPSYLEALRVHLRVSADIEIYGAGRNTKSLVEHALMLRKKDKLGYDQVWVVFDRDSFEVHLCYAALQLAEQNDINVAFSNECFELWFLLHFDSLISALPREHLFDKLKQRLGGAYEKNDPNILDKLLQHDSGALESAERRAEALEQHHMQVHGFFDPVSHAPCTGVYRLTRALREHGAP